MSKYFISPFFLIFCILGVAQDTATLQKDSTAYNEPYGLRFGIELSRPTITFFEPEYKGFEIVGDYRITQNLYIAAELGNEKRDRQEDLYNFTTSGSYLKVGIDYNTYSNWLDEQNLIYIGGRVALSSYNQTINNYQFFDSNRYWNPDGFADSRSEPIKLETRNATWLEAVVGIKTELIANIYLGGSLRLGALVPNKEKKIRNKGEFTSLFIPGFNKVTDGAIFGIGYNFSLTYFLPLYKKPRVYKKKKLTPQPVEEQPLQRF